MKISALTLCALLVLGVAWFAYYPWKKTSELVDGHVAFKDTYQPSDFGIEAKCISLNTEDGLTLVAWRVDAENPRAAVVIPRAFMRPP
jgi:hypothetical protein